MKRITQPQFENLPPGVKPEDCEPSDPEWVEESGGDVADRMED